ncbi:uncharacterized protein CC84DRAFT_863396 [Paraphaeosphaeria sporulosa]|uniref:Uncharacterized protein n=1 Tax=Paraphaeosphaeria sporulosa TaxID=1460663 RepID=A0A177CAA0_9PLEO|nr:uncharacterized protein CC84DRAFT_863396 [Paraphaeosphaeria sporulosa]OAG03698.1 hypothetical protein CC84DRAFT_863396 [Paraphaeosphaeria sporulosa]
MDITGLLQAALKRAVLLRECATPSSAPETEAPHRRWIQTKTQPAHAAPGPTSVSDVSSQPHPTTVQPPRIQATDMQLLKNSPHGSRTHRQSPCSQSAQMPCPAQPPPHPHPALPVPALPVFDAASDLRFWGVNAALRCIPWSAHAIRRNHWLGQTIQQPGQVFVDFNEPAKWRVGGGRFVRGVRQSVGSAGRDAA